MSCSKKKKKKEQRGCIECVEEVFGLAQMYVRRGTVSSIPPAAAAAAK